MSVLSLPRIHFKGSTLWSPSTANNHNIVYDEAAVAPILQKGWTYEDYVNDLKTENPKWCEPWGSWNLFGDHGVACDQTAVTGVQLAGGPPITDPLCGAAVNIQGLTWAGGAAKGRLVMTDPFSWGSETSMIVFDSVVVGSSQIGFKAKGAGPFFSKWGFRPSDQATAKTVGCPAPGGPARNLNIHEDLIFEGTESCCWWVGLPNATIQWAGCDQSPALAALRQKAESGGNQGIVFRFVSYCTQYYITYPDIKSGLDLVKAYAKGFTGDNPARSSMLGTIGVWEPGELSSAPTDLSLSPSGMATVPSTPTLSFSLGPAMARVDTDRGVVVLDLVNAIPELDTTLVKADLGPLQLCAGGSPIGSPIPYTAYEQSAYETTGGICEICIPQGVTVAGPLTLAQASGPAVLAQDEFLAETDDWVVYLDEGQTRQITVTVMQNGVAAPDSANLLLAQYNSRTGDLLTADQAIVQVDPPVVPVVDGKAVFSVKSLVSGACVIGFFPYLGQQPVPPASNYPMPNYRYTCIRALPFDDALEAGTPDSALTWEFVYANVLRTFDLMYPAMSKVVSLASLPAVQGMAVQLKAAIDESLFPSSLYMPITRDLSAGKRRLLQRFVNLMS